MPRRINYTRIAEKCITQLVAEFERNPYDFFSEDDVKCKLFMMLFQNDNIREMRRTLNGQFISSVHSEVSYFDDEGKLLLRVDLSAVDPGDTHVFSTSKRSGIKLAKGYRFGESHFAIEIKLNKLDGKPKMMQKWRKDLEKLQDIKSRNPSLTCFSIPLDKKKSWSDKG